MCSVVHSEAAHLSSTRNRSQYLLFTKLSSSQYDNKLFLTDRILLLEGKITAQGWKTLYKQPFDKSMFQILVPEIKIIR